MLGKKSRPMIGKLSELLVSGGRAAAVLDTIGSPRSPLDMMMKSPKGLKSYDLGGVGLGIVAALDKKSNERGREILPKHAVSTSKMNRSPPIPVQNQHGLIQRGEIDFGSSEEEDYTYVTYHVPNQTITKVYYDGGEGEILRNRYKINNDKNNVVVVTQNLVQDKPSFPTSDFLNSCHLCRKKLHGKDIYMYRGEKGFCSPECRSRQIAMDERIEICRSEALMSAELPSSPYTTRDQMFSTGIVAL